MFKTRKNYIFSRKNSNHLHCLWNRKSVNISSYPTLENCLYGAVKLTKHADVDQYKYLGCGIRFDRKGLFSVGNEIGKSVIIFGVDMSSSIKIDDRKKDILILGKGPT